MNERLARVIRNQGEEIWISLRRVDAPPEIELRVYHHPAEANAEPTRGKEKLVIPLDVFPTFVKALSQAQEALTNRGLLYLPPSAQTLQMDRGDPFALGAHERPRSQASRQHPRVTLNVRGECRLLDKKDFWPGKPVVGEVMNVSLGGAQARFPQRFPRFSQVELFMVVDGMLFRGRAEVAGTDAEPQASGAGGQFRHSLRWASLEGPARNVVTRIVESRAQKPSYPAP